LLYADSSETLRCGNNNNSEHSCALDGVGRKKVIRDAIFFALFLSDEIQSERIYAFPDATDALQQNFIDSSAARTASLYYYFGLKVVIQSAAKNL